MAQDDEHLRDGEPPPRRKQRSRSEPRDVPRADRMERRRNRFHAHDELPLDELRSIALYQKILILCILALLLLYAGLGVLQAMAPPNGRPNPLFFVQIAGSVAALVTGIASTVFVFLLATKAYNVGIGILLGILTLIPCLGLIVLLIINSQATAILTRNGVHVGFIGARKRDLDDLDRAEDEEDERD